MGVASAGLGAVGSIAQGIMGAGQASKAKKAIEGYRRQDLTNVAEGLSISTKGADLAREEMARISASSVEALKSGGVRGVVGGIRQVQDSVSQQSREIAADLDSQEKERQRLIAQDEARIREMQEKREQDDLAGLGQQLAVGQQNLFGGIAGLGKAAGNMAGMFGEGGGGNTPQVSSVNAGLTPMGLAGF